ncbi:mRNA surveillance protein pelota [Halorussus salilacus]|uniref:mRNA surveillance protein pelota n=1 Tax=Halorussus salilacus TaxID=2953750 RepID=UPI0020A1C854|nr:mRNA surveillance protein pelota [Halorussus salilacus]USZ67841.1 mRNA surveillance protein pelota [Halorussus salilacus]
MRIQSRQRVEGGGERITLVPESLDDLWHLTYVLEPGDLVSGDTTRRIQRNDDQMRDTGGEREHLWVAVEVEDVEFHKFANRLRVGGTIADCSREDQLGQHHTLNVEETKEIAIEKHWKPDQLDRLEEAEEATDNPDVAIVTVEEGQAHIHTVAQYGTEEYAEFSGTTGKGEYARDRDELFAEVADALGHLDTDAIVLAGPGFTKQDAYDYIADEAPELTEKITTVDTSAVGDRGVHEVLKRGAVEEVQKETRIAEEAELIDDLTQRIGEGAKVAYGVEQVKKAADYGAIEHLLILDERLREERSGEGEWDLDVNDLVTSVEQKGGDVTVFSSEFAPGDQLSGFGGVAALLRYRLE